MSVSATKNRFSPSSIGKYVSCRKTRYTSIHTDIALTFLGTRPLSTNCHEHQGTTRHDEAKYESVASNLKREILRHFPTVKVYLKPLLSDSSDKSIETQYARSRLGALEVQLCSNRDGKITKTTLFSKLKSKCWPSTNVVLNELRANMKTCSLTVSLVHGLLEPQNLGENQRNNPSENKLVNIEIILTPYRKQQG